MTETYDVKISYPTGGKPMSFHFSATDSALHPLAMRLRYVVANRARITDDTRDELEDLVEQEIREILEGQPICDELDEHLKGIGTAGAVEVEIPFTSEKVGWAARMMPWENVLGLMTRRHRSREPLLVVRYLNKQDREVATPLAETPLENSLLVVQSGPGYLTERYHLTEECEQVRDGYEDQSTTLWERSVLLPNPTLESLKTAAKERILGAHLAGVCAASVLQEQTFEMHQILDHQRYEQSPLPDGFILRSGSTKTSTVAGRRVHSIYQVVGAMEMARALRGDRERKDALQLVTFSSNFSAPRLAALAVGFGAARHAIGIQDSVTEEQCGQFFGGFYSDWSAGSEVDVLTAFFRSRLSLARNYDLGTAASFVLWSSESLLSELAEAVRKKDKPDQQKGKTVPEDDPESFISHWVKPVTRLNYSLLHNDQPLFEQFSVLKVKSGQIKPLAVEVSLDTGGKLGRALCRVTLPAQNSKYVYRLANQIRLPLVAKLMRSCQESMRTNLHVRLTCSEEVLLENNYPVRVLPADEWRDDGRDHCWLPSFVLPRDAAVLQIFERAQRCLRILADDSAAAFDGYQRVEPGAPDPWEMVDLQVKAIWAAIQHDMKINYFNPPPSYGTSSQRLRTPSQILQGSSATCIDISLLFCACLEYAGIYPVIFLIEGHAFPGYWRSEQAWWEMVSFSRALRLADQDGLSEAGVVAGASKGWMLEGEMAFTEVMTYIQEGSLVPFEATYATMGRRLLDALAEAPQNLTPETFDCMVDIWSARVQRVTPLPLAKFVP